MFILVNLVNPVKLTSRAKARYIVLQDLQDLHDDFDDGANQR